jgi:hypothetical protein
LHPFPYYLREGEGGRVQENKKWKNSAFETASDLIYVDKSPPNGGFRG